MRPVASERVGLNSMPAETYGGLDIGLCFLQILSRSWHLLRYAGSTLRAPIEQQVIPQGGKTAGRKRPGWAGECPGVLCVQDAKGSAPGYWCIDRAPQIAALTQGFAWRTGMCRGKGPGS